MQFAVDRMQLGACAMSQCKLTFEPLLAPPLSLILVNNSWLCSTHKHRSAFFYIFKVLTTTWRVPPDHILTNLTINWLLDANADKKITNFTDSERFKTPKTNCALKVYKDKEFYQLGFQVCWPWKFRVACHLKFIDSFVDSFMHHIVFLLTWHWNEVNHSSSGKIWMQKNQMQLDSPSYPAHKNTESINKATTGTHL